MVGTGFTQSRKVRKGRKEEQGLPLCAFVRQPTDELF